MKHKLTKPLTTVLTALILISCFVALYNIGLTSASPYYVVVFTETGLPSGTSWSVTFNGATKSETDDTISFSGYGWSQYSYSISSSSYAATPSSGSVTPSGNPIYISVSFETAGCTLVISATDGGTTQPTPGTYDYALQEDINILAIPDADHHFTGWIIDGTYFSDLGNPISGQLTGSYEVKALFAENPYSLTIITSGQGTVTPGNSTYNGQTVDLEATPAAGWTFSGWSGDATGTTNTTITMNRNKTVTATFTQITYILMVEILGQGTVNQGTQIVPAGTIIELTAIPAEGWSFSKWGGSLMETTPNMTLTMDCDKNIYAEFQKDRTLTINTIGQGTVTPGNTTYAHMKTANLTAIAADGWKFSGWSGDAIETTNTSILMDTDKTVTATFTRKPYIHATGGNISDSQFGEFKLVPDKAGQLWLNFTVTGKSGDYGTSTIVIPREFLAECRGNFVGVKMDGKAYDNWAFSIDAENRYFTFTCHFSTHTFVLIFGDPEPTPTPSPTETPAPTEEPSITPSPTAEPTTNPTTTPTTPPTPTTTPTTSPTTTPTITPAPTAPVTTQPTATTQPTTTSDLTLPIAAVVALLAAVLIGLVAKSRKHKW